MENVFQVEWDDYCQKVLEKNFPDVQRFRDIKEFDGKPFRGSVDVISGGFPCQPFSQAGKRKGTDDDRYLWPEMLRIIREIKPSFVVGENVAGLISMENGKTLDGILADLEDEGYSVESFVIPACALGAWHRRDRIWIVAYDLSLGRNEGKCKRIQSEIEESKGQKLNNLCEKRLDTNTDSKGSRQTPVSEKGQDQGLCQDVSDPDIDGSQRHGELRERGSQWITWTGSEPLEGIWESEPNVGRVANGVPRRVDRLKGLGNAIVPQIAYELFKAIKQACKN